MVGGGPAGSSAARPIAEAGYSVLVLDKKHRIGEPNHCGEGISTYGLAAAGVTGHHSWILNKVKGCKLMFPNNTEIRFTQTGYCIDRSSFDRFLSSNAKKQGAGIKTSVTVRAFSREQKGWVVRTNRGDYNSRYLIGAGGALCPVSRYFKQLPRILPAMQYKFKPEDVHLDFADDLLQFHHHEDFAGGYAWVFNRGKEVSIGGGAITDLKGRLERFCARIGVKPERRIKTEGGPIPFLPRPFQIAFPRALLCGDSGGFIYPLTKGGIHGAVWSGRIAGVTILEALEKDDSYALAHYPRRVNSYPCRDPLHLLVPQAFFKFDNRTINTIGRIMDGKEYVEIPVARFLRYFMTRPTPRILWGIAIGFLVQRFYHHSNKFAW